MTKNANQIIEYKLAALAKSSFRSSFHLKEKEYNYVKEKGLKTILEHTKEIVENKLAPATPKNDGKQTPTKNHPVFIAEHATATCCRSCLFKWHGIPKGKELNQKEKNYIILLIITWIKKDFEKQENK